VVEGRLWRDENKFKMVLKEGKRLSEALDYLLEAALDRDLELSLDCAQFVQAVHLIAVRRKLGSAVFDEKVDAIQKRIGRFQITADYSGAHYLALMSPSWRYARETGGSTPFKKYAWKDGRWEGGAEVSSEETEEQLLKEAPIGSRVTWRNEASTRPAFAFENSVKVGSDQYAAHGLRDPDAPAEVTPETEKKPKRNIFSKDELEKTLAPSKQTVKKEFPEFTEKQVDEWINDYVDKYVYVVEIEQYQVFEPVATTGPAK
jgi:hypothetical protein